MKARSVRITSVCVQAIVCSGIFLWIGLSSVAVIAAEIGQPVYDPVSKSYFELRDDNKRSYWVFAQQLAASKFHKGVRGRLAVVRNAHVHDFLRRNFQIDTWAWIGLRYWCKYRKLQWVTGEIHDRGEFSAWAQQWYRNADTSCGRGTATGPTAFMPVYYNPANSGYGFTWQAAGPKKGFHYYFVEYPAREAGE